MTSETHIINSGSGWDYDDLRRKIIQNIIDAKEFSQDTFKKMLEPILDKFVASLPDGVIIKQDGGLFSRFEKSNKPNSKKMKPYITVVRKTKSRDQRGKVADKKVVSVPKNFLPAIGTPIVVIEPGLLKAYEKLDEIFLKAAESKNKPLLQFLQGNLTPEDAALLDAVHREVHNDAV